MFLRTSGSHKTRRCRLVSATSPAALVGGRFPTTAALHEQSLKPLPPILQVLQILKGRTRRPRSIGILPVRNHQLGVWLRQL